MVAGAFYCQSRKKENKMKLTLKHVAIFGRIIVDTQDLNGSFYKTATLLELYKDGWFITERFGSVLSLCKPKANGEFMNRMRLFKLYPDMTFESFDALWQPLAEQIWNKHKNCLLCDENTRHKRKNKCQQ